MRTQKMNKATKKTEDELYCSPTDKPPAASVLQPVVKKIGADVVYV